MSDWKTYKLGEIVETRKEQIVSNGIEQPYIGLEHIEQQNLRLNGVGSSNDVVSNKFKFYNGDVLYGRLRPYFRKVYKPKFDGVCSTEIFVIKPKKDIDKDFLFYLVATEEFTNIANSGSSGTHMPRADWKQLEKSEWQIPDLPTQTQIAQILTSLDDKIELNLQMNQTLEAMAQALFKEWFVNFNFPNFNGVLENGLPKGWRIEKLGKVCEVKYGKDHKHLGDGNIPVYGSGGIMRFADKALYEKESILIPRKGTLTNLFYVSKPFWSVDTMFYTIIKEDAVRKYLFYLLKTLNLASMNVGSAVPSLTTEVLNKIDIVIPENSTLVEFEKITSSFYFKMEENKIQIQSLTQTRDTLLPKLMSGKLEVKSDKLKVKSDE